MEKYVLPVVIALVPSMIAVAWSIVTLYFNDRANAEKNKELQENQKLLTVKIKEMENQLATIKENRHHDILKFTQNLTKLEGELLSVTTIIKNINNEIKSAKDLMNSWMVKTK